jgi:hypothetical protein
MSHFHSRVIVTFVGGPLHGMQQALDAPPEQFWRDLPNGSALLYGRRWCSGDAGGSVSRDVPMYAVYSPVGMSEHAYRELLQTVDLEPLEALVETSFESRNKRSSGTP